MGACFGRRAKRLPKPRAQRAGFGGLDSLRLLALYFLLNTLLAHWTSSVRLNTVTILRLRMRRECEEKGAPPQHQLRWASVRQPQSPPPIRTVNRFRVTKASSGVVQGTAPSQRNLQKPYRTERHASFRQLIRSCGSPFPTQLSTVRGG